jgi:hypothetical protein
MGKKKFHKLVWKIKQIKTAKRMAVKKVIKLVLFTNFSKKYLVSKVFGQKVKGASCP